jgi:hypothetical protein
VRVLVDAQNIDYRGTRDNDSGLPRSEHQNKPTEPGTHAKISGDIHEDAGTRPQVAIAELGDEAARAQSFIEKR